MLRVILLAMCLVSSKVFASNDTGYILVPFIFTCITVFVLFYGVILIRKIVVKSSNTKTQKTNNASNSCYTDYSDNDNNSSSTCDSDSSNGCD